ELELVAVSELPDDRRDPLEADDPGGPYASLAGDEGVAVDGLGHEDRLDDAMLADALGKAGQGFVVHPQARLAWVLADAGKRDVDRTCCRRSALGDQGCQAATEALGAVAAYGHASTAAAGGIDADERSIRRGRSSRARISSARSRYAPAPRDVGA